MLRHLWFPSVTGKRLSTYGFESIDMWLTSAFLSFVTMLHETAFHWAHAPRLQDILQWMLYHDYVWSFTWLHLVFHLSRFTINMNLVCAYVPSRWIFIRSIDISLCWDVLAMSFNRHVHKTWLHADIITRYGWCPPCHMTLHSWSMIHEYLLIY
jgi:hypothetical protein